MFGWRGLKPAALVAAAQALAPDPRAKPALGPDEPAREAQRPAAPGVRRRPEAGSAAPEPRR